MWCFQNIAFKINYICSTETLPVWNRAFKVLSHLNNELKSYTFEIVASSPRGQWYNTRRAAVSRKIPCTRLICVIKSTKLIGERRIKFEGLSQIASYDVRANPYWNQFTKKWHFVVTSHVTTLGHHAWHHQAQMFNYHNLHINIFW